VVEGRFQLVYKIIFMYISVCIYNSLETIHTLHTLQLLVFVLVYYTITSNILNNILLKQVKTEYHVFTLKKSDGEYDGGSWRV
jgi:hypothetical protein